MFLNYSRFQFSINNSENTIFDMIQNYTGTCLYVIHNLSEPISCWFVYFRSRVFVFSRVFFYNKECRTTSFHGKNKQATSEYSFSLSSMFLLII